MSGTSAERLGERYRLVSVRAEFPFGTYWESEDDQGARTLVLRFSDEVEDPEAKVREAMAEAAQLDHPQVVPWADGGVTDGVGWLAAPMFGPWSLQDHVLRNEGLAPLDAAPIMHQVARTLAVTEGVGLVHHCLASELVRLVPIPEGGYAVKIYGYGVHHILPPYKPLRKNAAYIGVPDYMAPELCAGKPADALADVYAVGILMYEAIRGRPPFAPTFASASASTTLKRQIFEKPLALHVRYTSVPHIKPYENIALKALAKSANRRQASMAALEEELAQLVTGEMRGALVSVTSASSRPATTSRRTRTQVLPSLGGQAEAETELHEALDGGGAAEHVELNEELAAASESYGEERAGEQVPVGDAAMADDGGDEAEELIEEVAPEPKRRGDATLVFAGLGPRVRELARERAEASDDDDDDAWDDRGAPEGHEEEAPAEAEATAPAEGEAEQAASADGEESSAGQAPSGAAAAAADESGDDDHDDDEDDKTPRTRKGKRRRKKKRGGHGKEQGTRSETGTRPEMVAVPARGAATVVGMEPASASGAAEGAAGGAAAAAAASVEGTDQRRGAAATSRPPTKKGARVRRNELETILDVPSPKKGSGASAATDEQEDWFVAAGSPVAAPEEVERFVPEKKPAYFWYVAIPLAILIVVLVYFLTRPSDDDALRPSTPASEGMNDAPPTSPARGPSEAPGDDGLAAARNAREAMWNKRAAATAGTTQPGAEGATEATTAGQAAPDEAAPDEAAPTEPTPPPTEAAAPPTAPTPPPTEAVAPPAAPAPTPAARPATPPAPARPAATAESAQKAAAQSHYLAGLQARARGDLAGAIRELEAAVKADPTHAQASASLADARSASEAAAKAKAEAAAKAKAEAAAKAAAAPKPSEPAKAAEAAKPADGGGGQPETTTEESFRAQSRTYIKRGIEAYQKGNYKLAASYFDKAQALDSENKLVANYLKMARERLKDE